MLFVLMAYYIGLNRDIEGKGMDFYLGGENSPSTFNPEDLSLNRLFIDAYNQVFFSVGVCVGVLFSYGSYNHIKKPVIADAFIIAILDFLFSIMSGTIVWGALGYLMAKDSPAQNQTSSVGLAFIAMPVAASLAEDGNGYYVMFTVFLFFTGITSGFGFVEAFVTNIIDQTAMARWKVALGVCMLGMALCASFTSNVGWILFDMTDHFITDYIVITVGILECVSVGWIFEQEKTACCSPLHRKSLKVLALIYWIPL